MLRSQVRQIMSLLSGVEVVGVLVVIGILFLLSLRLRSRISNVILLMVIAVLVLALISLSRLAMTLLGVTLILGASLVLLALISFRPR